jgi:hypothetical protein
VARITYGDAKLSVDETRDIVVVAPLGDGVVALDWEHAEPADFGVADLASTAPAALPFGPVPAAATQAKNYAAWEKEFGRWAGRSQAVELLRSARAKLTSVPGESERDFRVRLQTAFREGRDRAVAKVREKHAAKIRTAEDRLRRAQAAVARESEQAAESKVSAAVSLGATVLGALLGRKAASAATLGRATTAARGMGRVSREAADVGRAKEQVAALEQQLGDAQTALESDLESAAHEWDGAADTLDRVTVKPKRGGVSVQLVGLLWRPL